MSYDLYLKDPVTHDTLHPEQPHFMRGGTYCIGGTTEMWINITSNYAGTLERVLGEGGIRRLDGMTGAESVPLLKASPHNCSHASCLPIIPSYLSKMLANTQSIACAF